MSEGEEGTWYILMKTIYFPFYLEEETNDTAKSHVRCVTNLHIFTLISPFAHFSLPCFTFSFFL